MNDKNLFQDGKLTLNGGSHVVKDKYISYDEPRNDLKKIVLPDKLSDNLKEIVLPKKNVVLLHGKLLDDCIEINAFNHCKNLKASINRIIVASYYGRMLKCKFFANKTTLEENVIHVSCEELDRIIDLNLNFLGDLENLIEIDNYSFINCYNLSSINIGTAIIII